MMHVIQYRIARKFGRELNLANWLIWESTAKLTSTKLLGLNCLCQSVSFCLSSFVYSDLKCFYSYSMSTGARLVLGTRCYVGLPLYSSPDIWHLSRDCQIKICQTTKIVNQPNTCIFPTKFSSYMYMVHNLSHTPDHAWKYMY